MISLSIFSRHHHTEIRHKSYSRILKLLNKESHCFIYVKANTNFHTHILEEENATILLYNVNLWENLTYFRKITLLLTYGVMQSLL